VLADAERKGQRLAGWYEADPRIREPELSSTGSRVGDRLLANGAKAACVLVVRGQGLGLKGRGRDPTTRSKRREVVSSEEGVRSDGLKGVRRCSAPFTPPELVPIHCTRSSHTSLKRSPATPDPQNPPPIPNL